MYRDGIMICVMQPNSWNLCKKTHIVSVPVMIGGEPNMVTSKKLIYNIVIDKSKGLAFDSYIMYPTRQGKEKKISVWGGWRKLHSREYCSKRNFL